MITTRDYFIQPGEYSTSSAEDAILFSNTDEPVMRSLGLYHEAPATQQA